MGQKVGNGECFALANEALHEGGGTRRFKDDPGKGDYVTQGTLVYYVGAQGVEQTTSGQLGTILPGDIIQFRSTFLNIKKAPTTTGITLR